MCPTDSETPLTIAENERRHRAELEAVYDTAPVGLCILDTRLRWVRINRRLAEINGLPAEAHIGKRPSEVLGQLGIEAEKLLQRVLDTGEPMLDVELTGELASSPGTQRTWVEQWVPLRDDQGAIVGISVVAEEVTSMRSQDRALRESEERFRETFERAPIGIAHVGLDGRFLRLNDRLCEITGYSRAELERLAFQDITWHEDLEADLASARRLAAGEIPSYAMEKRYVRKDGSLVWVNLTGSLVRDERGDPRYFIGIVEDLSARKEAEQREQLLRDASAMVSQTLDPDEVLRQMCRLLVGSLADWCMVDMRTPAGDVRRFPVMHRDPAKQPLVEALAAYSSAVGAVTGGVLRTGEAALIEQVTPDAIRAGTADPGYASALLALDPRSVVVVPIVIAGTVEGVFACARSGPRPAFDRADLNVMEGVARRVALAFQNARLYMEAQEANRLKDDFIATLSHELRTPLNAMLGWLSMIQSKVLDPEQYARALATIERNARAQAQLVGDILDVSRIVSGKIVLDRSDTALGPLVERVVETMRLGAIEKGITLRLEIEPGVYVHGDVSRLQQVVWNLLSNAIKFTPPGGRVDVRLERDAGTAVLTVRDTGIGIQRDFLPHVFDRFRQADPSTTRSHSGLGLGLAIASHLVHLHDGTIEAFSDGEHRGATFTVRLPLIASAGVTPGIVERVTTTPALSGVRVLVVEDHADTATLMRVVLEAQGADVQVGTSSVEAEQLYRDHGADLALIDISMPGEDGFSCLARLRAAAAERGAMLPALAVTAHTLEHQRAAFEAAGFDAHVPKPVEPGRLLAAIRAALPR